MNPPRFTSFPIVWKPRYGSLVWCSTPIGADYRATPGHAQKIAQLPRAAADFQNEGAVADLLIQQLGKNTAPRLQAERFGRIEVIVIRKRRPFAERLHRASNVWLVGRPVVLPKQLRDAVVHGESVAAIFAGHLVGKGIKVSTANRTGQ
jgi:hypothetical protein